MTRYSSLFFGLIILLAGCGQKDETKAPENAPVVAENPDGLTFPVACTPGKDCWITRYMDRDTGPGTSDYLCGNHSQNGHKGVDIAVADLGVMATSVPVLAVARGKILRVRDGEPDISARETEGGAPEGRECGNGLVIRHDDGFESQYCHLKQGSITLSPGAQVEKGQQVGAIGLSGETEYPHVHYMLRQNGALIDPFDGKPTSESCNAGGGTSLWVRTPGYQPVVMLPLTVSATPPDRAEVWDAPKALSRHAANLVITARAFHTQTGDTWHLVIKDPRGSTFFDKTATLERGHQFYYQYMGRKAPQGGLMPGIWTATLTASRGSDYQDKQKIEFQID